MKLIERSPIGAQGTSIPFFDRVKGIWAFGLTWDRDTQAQQVLIKQLGSMLDNSYTLITNVPVSGFSFPVPLVLVGKTGLRTFCVSADTGIFSLKNEKWYKLDEEKEQYRSSRPNLVRRTALMSRAIIEYLKDKGIFLDEYEPTLYFTKPGVHIDADESPVNLLQSDGIDRFAANLVNEDVVLDAMELQRITEILITSKPLLKAKKQELPSRSTLSSTVGFGDFRLKAWQWLILFVLAVFMLITVIITAVIILNTT
jgi:hypothetical protein